MATEATIPRNQAQDAQKLYDDRAASYDNTWHPRFARHIVELAHLQPGEKVLDLACGTGLVTFPASTGVGETGHVTGIDVSSGMLAQARAKRKKHGIGNITFHQHSITDLRVDSLHANQFDVIFCASALVLLEHPGQALQDWTRYLKPGGRLITDVTHPECQISLITFERVGRRLGRSLPFYRVPFQQPEDLQRMLEDAGLRNIYFTFLSQLGHRASEDIVAFKEDLAEPRIEATYTVEDTDLMFDKHIGQWAAEPLSTPDVIQKAREIFKEEWAKLADESGRIQEVDGVFVGIGRKPG
ncbi:hypothetical protein LTR62_001878 [Meristemomyces frigidus]|uniref:Methyltransferase domain-containing protein n=1 Tax=Meristemomyces frigidus TaxID=1508187 RepID=A0AAN7T901_9PEZI|nr:hypothetical protein LTR62_001878 [Meristemomyces frigidus]